MIIIFEIKMLIHCHKYWIVETENHNTGIEWNLYVCDCLIQAVQIHTQQ